MSRLARILSTTRAGRARAWYGKCLQAGNVYEETDQELGISGKAGTIPKKSFRISYILKL